MSSNKELPVLSKTHKFLGFVVFFKNYGYITKFEIMRPGVCEFTSGHYVGALTWDNITEPFKIIEFFGAGTEIRLLFIDEINNHRFVIPLHQTDAVSEAPLENSEYFEDISDDSGSYWEKRTKKNECDVPGGYFDY